MSARIRGNARVKSSFTSTVHVFSGTVRKEEGSFLRLQELLPFQKVYGLQIDEVLNQDNGVRKIKSRGFLNLELADDALQRVEQCCVHALLVADPGDFGEEETRNL